MYIKTITDYLDKTAKKYPEKIGVKDIDKQYTFSKIRENALKVGSVLGEMGLFKKPIAIFLDKNVDCFC